ncbi:helix-turn-helix domain-containing protein [Pedobacter sandarakinus]|uniref:helix-turn-helix domain-containing protein n=1 Tax=Pedobacter sandarakinus TaxID=353156 RepID=UPI003898F36D
MDQVRKEKILKLFGLHLKDLRNKRNISLRVLEQIADVDYSQIHRIEKGETAPSLLTMIAIAEGLGITLAELVNFSIDAEIS